MNTAIEGYDELSAEVAERQRELEGSRPRTSVSELPKAAREIVRDEVLSYGPLEGQIKGRRRVSEPGKARIEEFNQHRLESFYSTLVVDQVKDDNKLYYYPEELAQRDNLARGYMRRCQKTEPEIKTAIEDVHARLAEITKHPQGVDSLERLIPKGFTRSDQVVLNDRFTGRAMDVTAYAKKLRAEGHEEYVHVVVMKNGKHVYFIDEQKLMSERGNELWETPNYEELVTIAKDQNKFIEFVSALKARQDGVATVEPVRDGVLVGRKNERVAGKVIRLEILPAGSFNDRSKDHFQVKFHRAKDGKVTVQTAEEGQAISPTSATGS